MLQPIEQTPLPTRETIDRAVAITAAVVEDLEQLLLAAIAARTMALAYEGTEEIEASKEDLEKATAPGWAGRNAVDRIKGRLGTARDWAKEAQQYAREYERIVGRSGQPK